MPIVSANISAELYARLRKEVEASGGADTRSSILTAALEAYLGGTKDPATAAGRRDANALIIEVARRAIWSVQPGDTPAAALRRAAEEAE